MSNQENEIAQLRAEIAGLRGALSTAIAMAKVTNELASALAVLNEHPQTLLQVFNALVDASDGPLQYSSGTDEDLKKLDAMREAVRMQLQPARQKP